MGNPATPQASGEDRSRAIVAFLSSGTSPAPPRAHLVSALANARRQIAQLDDAEQRADWLRDQLWARGIQENAAVLDTLEAYRPQFHCPELPAGTPRPDTGSRRAAEAHLIYLTAGLMPGATVQPSQTTMQSARSAAAAKKAVSRS